MCLTYSASNTVVTFKFGLEKWYHSKAVVWFPIRIP